MARHSLWILHKVCGRRRAHVTAAMLAVWALALPGSAVALPPALNAARADAFIDHAEPPRAAAPAPPPPVQIPAEQGETLDRYAERLLQHRLHAPPPTAEAAQAALDPAGQVGAVGPSNLDLIYLAGTGSRSQAYIRIDNKYAKRMGVGEFVAGWRLKAIGVDHVDIIKDDEQARLYLFSSKFDLKNIEEGESSVY